MANPSVAQPVLPFLKWPGGKRWAAARIAPLIRRQLRGTYYEPFIGGGAVFFHLRPVGAVLSDVNADLINVYRVVRSRAGELRRALKGLPVSRRQYDALRVAQPRSQFDRAVRLLYLNRTCFGGIYRLNQSGKFNVPYGGGERTPRILWETDLLLDAAEVLADAEMRTQDFGVAFKRAVAGDVVYCDPTYTVAHDNNGFVRYNERNFSWLDQVRLAQLALGAVAMGVAVIVCNAHHRSLRALYPSASFRVLHRTSHVSTDSTRRRSISEYLIILTPR